MIQASIGTEVTALLEGADAGLTITAVLVDGSGVRGEAVTVTPRLDTHGDPLDAYDGSFTPLALPVMLRWLQGASVVGEEVVSDDASLVIPGAPAVACLEGAPVGLTLTARLLGGNDAPLGGTVVVAPLLDSDGLPLDAYTATYVTPSVLPFAMEWRQGSTRVGYEVIATEPVDTDSDLGRFRLELGDLNPSSYLFSDSQAAYYIALHPTNILLSVADALDALANRFAGQFDFDTTSSKSFKLSQKAKMYADRAKTLRERALIEGGTDGASGTALYSFPGPYEWVLA